MKKLYIALLLLMAGPILWAQPSLKQLHKKGKKAFEQENYYAALDYLSQALVKDEDRTDIRYIYAIAAKRQHAYPLAQQSFETILNGDDSEKFPDVSFHLAQIMQTKGRYEDALQYYQMYLSEFDGDNTMYSLEAKRQLQSTQWAIQQLDEDLPELEIEHLDRTVNSPYSEHAALSQDGELTFTSLRYPKYKDKYKPARLVSKILSVSHDESNADTASTLIRKGDFNNDEFLTSSMSYSPDGKLVVYSKCEYVTGDQIECDLIYHQINSSGVWSKAKKFGKQINEGGATSTHAAFGKEADDVYNLYFVSNRIGSKGGLDIWKSEINKLTLDVSKALNLKAVNTVYDEITPYYSAKDDQLFFSSNGREGMGGYDVYSYELNGAENEIQNVGRNLNSSYNEIFYSIDDKQEFAYLSSNRPGSLHLDDQFETCCYDIYKVHLDRCVVDLQTLVFDRTNGQELSGFVVELQRVAKDGKLSSIDISDVTSTDYKVELDCDEEYQLTFSKPGYLPATLKLGADELTGEPLLKKVYLTPETLELQVSTHERATENPISGVTLRIVEMEDQEIEVGGIQNNPSHLYTNPVSRGKRYRLVASKKGYDDETIIFVVPADQEGPILKKLYMGRVAEIASLNDLIPLRLYFDNDQPDPKTMSHMTQKTYTETYGSYYNNRGPYTAEYTKHYIGAEKDKAQANMDFFFDQDLKSNYERLEIFMETLTRILQTGKKVNLYLRGFASPVAGQEYNFAIGKRRVQSIRNEFDRYRGGFLKTYLSTHQLIITERSFGEDTSAAYVSDDPTARHKSVLDPSAGRERRIEIDEIQDITNLSYNNE